MADHGQRAVERAFATLEPAQAGMVVGDAERSIDRRVPAVAWAGNYDTP